MKEFKNYINLIKESKLFAAMAEEDVYSMLNCLAAVKVKYKKGEYIYHAGDMISKVAMVFEGAVHIEREDYWGNKSILTEAGAGDLIGEAYSCLEGEAMAVNAVAVKDSLIMLMDMKKIFTTCTSVCPYHARLIQNFIFVIASRNRELTRKMAYMSQRTTREKLLSYLSDQSIKSAKAAFDIPFNRQQLADFLSVDRSAMSTELGKLRDEGIIAFNKNHFRLIKSFDI